MRLEWTRAHYNRARLPVLRYARDNGMNFVGHLLLTTPTPAGWLGAILGDFVKGPLAGRYEPDLERAIALHRAIDRFTDNHPAVRASVARVSTARRRYGGILVDIFYDHFLLRHWAHYGGEPLDALVVRTYALLMQERDRLPERLQAVAPRMVAQDWLRANIRREQLALTLRRVSTRLRRGEPLATGVEEFDAHQQHFEADFHCFLPDVIAFADSQRAPRLGAMTSVDDLRE